MRKSIIKVVSMLVAVLMLTVAFSGCGSNSAKTQKAAKIETIRYARWGLPEEMNGTKKIIAAFEKKHSNIKVVLENSSWDQYWEKIQTEIASKTAPDAMLFDAGWYLHQFAPQGVLEDIGTYMKKDNISKDDYYNVWETFTYNNNIYALPRDYNSIVLFYNKDLFKAAGITQYPDGSMTWQQVAQLAKKLTIDKNGRNATDPKFDLKKAVQYGLYLPTNNVDSTIETLIWQNGGKLMSDDGSKCLINSNQAKSALQFLYDLTYKYKVSPSAADAQKYGEEAFPTGKFAMVYQGSWLASSLSSTKFDWDIAVAPYSSSKVYCAQSVGNSILSSSKHKDAAWEFLKFMSGKEGQTIMAQTNDSIPVLKDVAENYYMKLSGKPQNKKAIFDEAVSTVPYVDYPQKSKIFDAITNITTQYFNKQTSLDKTVNKVMSQVKTIQSSAQ